MSKQHEQILREECRLAVRTYLYDRQPLPFNCNSIARGLRMEGAYQDHEVIAALNFLQGLGEVKSEPAALGATLYWKITAQGVLAHERS